MLAYFNAYIKPANEELGRLLADVHCDHCGYISRGDAAGNCPICNHKLTKGDK